MSGGCTFIRLLAEEDKGVALTDAIDALQNGEVPSAVFSIDPEKFSMVPGSPFAYWVSDRIRRLFRELPPFGGEGRTIKQGLATADDFRFVRAWWEVAPTRIVSGTPETSPEEFRVQTFSGKKWVPFAKGGEYSPYYADVHLVVNWGNDGEELREFPRAYIRNEGCYFRPGLTWPLRTNGLSFRAMPKGCIFAHKGPAIFVENDVSATLLKLSGIAQSITFNYLVSALTARVTLAQSYEVGLIKSIPVPKIPESETKVLDNCTNIAISIPEKLQSSDETCHVYSSPVIFVQKVATITDSAKIWDKEISHSIEKANDIQKKIDAISFDLYGITDLEQERIMNAFCDRPSPINAPSTDPSSVVADLLSYTLGTIFGRWDVRYATGEREPPELPDPFAPLPACSPGMLQGEDGLPLEPHEIPSGYPLKVDADGILVDDEGHPDDIIARIRDVLALIWGNRADAIEKEACEILGVKLLRDYFRKPGAGGFWDDHVKRYSKSRRKAPIYWLLQSAKKNYAIWIYYPRMDGDTLYKALRYAKDKLAMEARRLEDLQKEREQSGTGGAVVKKMEKEIDGQEAFISELHDFVEKLERVANLNLIPEHDDGVVLTIAPLRELVPWNEPKNYWDELIEGKYAWSSIGKQLAEKGLVKV
jgi:hypothetical protein